jgi:hypothetical protein
MALMAFVPGSAVIVAPLLIAYNSAPVIDRIETESERGTLTLGEAATSVGEIALNLLPLVGKAKPFTSAWFVVEGANWGGQAVLMAASAKNIALALQSQDVEALAGLYEDLQKAEHTPGADPAEIEQKRQAIMMRAKEVSDRLQNALTQQITTNAMFAIAGSVIHNAGTEFQRGQLIDGYLNTRGAGSGELEASGGTGDHAHADDSSSESGGKDASARSGSNVEHKDDTRQRNTESNSTSKSEQHPTAADHHAGAHEKAPPAAETDQRSARQETTAHGASRSSSRHTEASAESEAARPHDAAAMQKDDPALQSIGLQSTSPMPKRKRSPSTRGSLGTCSRWTRTGLYRKQASQPELFPS